MRDALRRQLAALRAAQQEIMAAGGPDPDLETERDYRHRLMTVIGLAADIEQALDEGPYIPDPPAGTLPA